MMLDRLAQAGPILIALAALVVLLAAAPLVSRRAQKATTPVTAGWSQVVWALISLAVLVVLVVLSA